MDSFALEYLLTHDLDRLWHTEGGQENVTCKNEALDPFKHQLWCGSDISVPECADRGVYCSFPDTELEFGEVDVLSNPVPDFYRNENGKIKHEV